MSGYEFNSTRWTTQAWGENFFRPVPVHSHISIVPFAWPTARVPNLVDTAAFGASFVEFGGASGGNAIAVMADGAQSTNRHRCTARDTPPSVVVGAMAIRRKKCFAFSRLHPDALARPTLSFP